MYVCIHFLPGSLQQMPLVLAPFQSGLFPVCLKTKTGNCTFLLLTYKQWYQCVTYGDWTIHLGNFKWYQQFSVWKENKMWIAVW